MKYALNVITSNKIMEQVFMASILLKIDLSELLQIYLKLIPYYFKPQGTVALLLGT